MQDACPGLSKWGDHHAINGEFRQEYQGKGVMLMRQPDQRLISSYEHNQHDWPMGWSPAQSLTQYAQVIQGCTVRMLTHNFSDTEGAGASNCGEMSPLTDDNVEEAKRRLKQFAFVGLTEEWDLSICLFRAKFGGLCYGSDFGDTRLADDRGTKTEGHDTSVLEGFRDHIDGQLYETAQEIFAAEKQRYGVNEASCKPCWDHADTHWTEHS